MDVKEIDRRGAYSLLKVTPFDEHGQAIESMSRFEVYDASQGKVGTFPTLDEASAFFTSMFEPAPPSKKQGPSLG